LQAADLLRDPEQRLHVMAHLVSDDVCLREITRGAEPILQIAEEGGVEVDLLIGRTVERPGRRLRHSARGIHGAGEEHEPWLLVLAAHVAKEHAPRVLRVGQHRGHEFLHRIGAG
jgi:hypothetical protein